MMRVNRVDSGCVLETACLAIRAKLWTYEFLSWTSQYEFRRRCFDLTSYTDRVVYSWANKPSGEDSMSGIG